MEIKTTKQIQKKHPCDDTKWIAVNDLNKRLSVIMDTGNYEADMRDLITSIQQELTQ